MRASQPYFSQIGCPPGTAIRIQPGHTLWSYLPVHLLGDMYQIAGTPTHSRERALAQLREAESQRQGRRRKAERMKRTQFTLPDALEGLHDLDNRLMTNLYSPLSRRIVVTDDLWREWIIPDIEELRVGQTIPIRAEAILTAYLRAEQTNTLVPGTPCDFTAWLLAGRTPRKVLLTALPGDPVIISQRALLP